MTSFAQYSRQFKQIYNDRKQTNNFRRHGYWRVLESCKGLQVHFEGVIYIFLGVPDGSDGKEPACNAEDSRLIPGLARSPGVGNGNPLLYSCLENSMDRGAWRAIVHGVAKSQTWLKRLEHARTPEQTAGTLSIAVQPLGTLDLSSFLCQRGFIVPIPVGGRKD